MIIHCTKKLIAKLPKSLQQDVAISSVTNHQLTQWQHWHANILTIERKQCVILIHDTTRYAVFLSAMDKKALTYLDLQFQDVFLAPIKQGNN